MATTTTTIIITVATIITTTGYKNDNMLTKSGQKMSEQGLRTQGECKSILGLDSFVLRKQLDRQRITLGKQLKGSGSMLPRSYREKKFPSEKGLQDIIAKETNIMEAISRGVCPRTSCWKEPLVNNQKQALQFTTAQRVLLQLIQRTR